MMSGMSGEAMIRLNCSADWPLAGCCHTISTPKFSSYFCQPKDSSKPESTLDERFNGSIHQVTDVAVPEVLGNSPSGPLPDDGTGVPPSPQPASESAMTAHARNAEMLFFMFVPLFTPFYYPETSGFQRFQFINHSSKLPSLVFNAMYFCFVFTVFRHR